MSLPVLLCTVGLTLNSCLCLPRLVIGVPRPGRARGHRGQRLIGVGDEICFVRSRGEIRHRARRARGGVACEQNTHPSV